MSQSHIDKHAQHQARKTMCGALVGVGIVALVQILSVNSLDLPLKISICSFAVSIPALSAVFICMLVEESYAGLKARNQYLNAITLSGYVFALIGVGALFFHFAVYAGVIFMTISLIGVLAVALYVNQVATRSKNR